MRLRAIVLDRIKSNYSRNFPLFPVVGQLINRPSSLRPMSTAPPADLPTQIAELGAQIKQLKLAKQPCEPEIQRLKDLKALLPKSDAPVSVPLAVGQKGKSKVGVEAHGKLSLKVPKGTRDFHAQDTTVRRKIFSTLETIFQKHGASTIDTPVFELKEILAGKYGEDSKLIYDLQDQGGELCSLRYDLTVPFARYLAMNGVVAMKRYHIAKVYRRDQPAMSKGRLREFYQCDFDIAGVYDAMVPDAEILSILCEALTALDIGDFTVKINHRKILDGIFSLCGVPESSIRAISSAVDKLDKAPWEVVKKEMVEEKGLDPVIADKIGEYVKLKGRGWELLDILEKDANLNSNASAAAGLKDMRILFEYLDVYGCLEKMSFDLSLARGLDYYTGIIYEAITELSAPPSQSVVPSIEPASPAAATTPVSGQTAPSSTANKKEGDEIDESTVGVGSIAAGGRYDNLVGMFTTAASGAQGKAADREMTRNRVPCVGISVGVERVYAIMMAKQAERERLTGKAARGKETEVYVMSVGDGLIKERMQICKELWEAGIKAEFMYKVKPKGARAQFDVIDRDSIPFAVIIGSDELQGGTVKIKEQAKSKEDVEANGVDVKRTEMIDWLKEKIRTLEA